MYIRRKLYSTFEDENGEERLFSSTEFVDEDQYLDEMMYSDEEPEQKEYASIRSQAKALSRIRDIGKKISRRGIENANKEEVINKVIGIAGRSGRAGKGIYNTTNPSVQKALGRFARVGLRESGQPVTKKAVKNAVDLAKFNSRMQSINGGKGRPLREIIGI
jgi:hypothetical protein